MRRALFDFVDRIRDDEKYLDVSTLEIRRALLAKGKCHLEMEYDLTLADGKPITADLRLNINALGEHPTSWTMALKLHDTRIDGFDFETKFDMLDGQEGRGWHRHHWDAVEESAKYHKLPVSALDKIDTREDFIIRGLSLLKIRVNPIDHGQDLFLA